MTAWQILVANSTLSGGTAWQHLNAQGDANGNGDIYIYGELEVELVTQEYSVEIAGDYEVELEQEFTVELENEAL